MHALAVIPARGGSASIPRKNIRPLAGRPLLSYAIEALQGAARVDRIVVSTEDSEIAQVARQWGAEVPFRRPQELATDEAPSLPVLLHAANVLATQGYEPEWVALVQPTSPFLRSETIDRALEECFLHGHRLLKTITAVHEHPYWMCTLTGRHLVPFLPKKGRPRRQDLPPVFRLNGAVTVVHRELLSAGGLDGVPEAYWIMDALESMDIDTELDWELAEWRMERAVDPAS